MQAIKYPPEAATSSANTITFFLFFFVMMIKIYQNTVLKTKNNCLSLYNKNIEEVLPYLCSSNMYVGNDSFGSHITSQSGIKSLVILLDSPKAYTDYSKNYQRIVPNGIKIDDVTHGSNLNPKDISVEEVYQEIIKNKF